MTKSETDRIEKLNQTEPVRNPELVRMVVESSAENTVPFKKLPEAVQIKIIDGMTEALTEDELRFRGHWNIRSVDVCDWKRGTLDALHKNSCRDSNSEETEVTLTGIKLAQLVQDISAEFRIYSSDLLDPVRRVFQRSADTLESGFTSYVQTKKYRGKRINSGICEPGHTRYTLPQTSKFTINGRKIS